MTVTCIRDQGDFPILVIPHDPLRSLSEENYITSKGGATIGGNMLQYQLTVGREYTVFSVLFFEQLVRYLVADDDNMPCFIPSDVFRIQDNSVPFDWAAANYKLKNGNLFLLGYSPLSDNYAELTSLLRQTPDAVEHFLDYWHSEWHEYIE